MESRNFAESILIAMNELGRTHGNWFVAEWTEYIFGNMPLDDICECNLEVHFSKMKMKCKAIVKPIRLRFIYRDAGRTTRETI